MKRFDRLPAIPLIANDPYFSVWLPADLPNQAHTVHWAGSDKHLTCHVTVDGVTYRCLGSGGNACAKVTYVSVTPTRTSFTYAAGGVHLKITFCSPALPDDLDILSTPITFVDFETVSLDDKPHNVKFAFNVSDQICYDGASHPEMFSDSYVVDGLNVLYVGQKQQKLLVHSGDHITIDWGYLYMASTCPICYSGTSAQFVWSLQVGNQTERANLLLGYDDVASINYFGTPCKAWYARNGKTMVAALCEFAANHDALLARCAELDEKVVKEAQAVGGDDYAEIASAAWRHTFAAHKLIATPAGEMALLSKENDSNGCIGTVDVSYPSTPIFLAYCPELVNALCRPILEFASMPVWPYDFAPHDVGRYPYATGQVYSLKQGLRAGDVVPPYYQYPAGTDVYSAKNQMPVEECGNMLVMLYAALHFGAKDTLVRQYAPLLETWVNYLLTYGEDPGEQLCTDDFAGHLAHNINLSAKAVVGIACYGKLLAYLGDSQKGEEYIRKSQALAQSWLARAEKPDGTALTFDGQGWSMKYNLVWDRVLNLELLPAEFYAKETASYLSRQNTYGLPLDSRNTYTKSDWICWCAALCDDIQTRQALLAPVAKYLRESGSRVAFSDWYDTKTGVYVEFIARSVQGGVFMPLLRERTR